MAKMLDKLEWYHLVIALAVIFVLYPQVQPQGLWLGDMDQAQCLSLRQSKIDKGYLCVSDCFIIDREFADCIQYTCLGYAVDVWGKFIGEYTYFAEEETCENVPHSIEGWDMDCVMDCVGIRRPQCGDGVCDSSESYSTCPQDCQAPGCTIGETQACTIDTCPGTQTCVNMVWGSCIKTDPNCGTNDIVCGDGVCHVSEVDTCPQDCYVPPEEEDCIFKIGGFCITLIPLIVVGFILLMVLGKKKRR